MATIFMFDQRKGNLYNHQITTQKCDEMFNWKNTVSDQCAPFDKRAFIELLNSSKFHYNAANNIQQSYEYCKKTNSIYDEKIQFHDGFVAENCNREFPRKLFPTSMLDNEHDLRSAQNIFNTWKAIACKINSLSKKRRSQMFRDPSIEKVNVIWTYVIYDKHTSCSI